MNACAGLAPPPKPGACANLAPAVGQRSVAEPSDGVGCCPYLPLLKRDCTLVVVGALEVMAPVNNQQVAFHRRSISGSLIRSIAKTQEVIDFCARHGIGPDIEMLRIQDLNETYARIEQGGG